MSKRTFTIAAIAAVAILAAGALFASNMGFKLNYQLANAATQGGFPANGTNTLGLPYVPQVGLVDAGTLENDIGSTAVQNIQKYLEASNTTQTYATGDGANNFALVAGEAYFVRMVTTVPYTPSHY